ncbi:polysaccharide deacetylase family protein [Thalassobacillus pellis]|uniref:polysaccharide deacetylase family protein n=1 Tax=Thalassobacillus pellis TaxID=748008 RepID=UPI001960AEF9|nr:polysaccharide deacetylase family protein [Thalassobacillus pellis]MBM7553239.1 hypothetical protein [Thalassobacillus pellis]
MEETNLLRRKVGIKSLIIILIGLFLFFLIGCSDQAAMQQDNQKQVEASHDESTEDEQDKVAPDKSQKEEGNQPEKEAQLVEYTGPVEHIFFHPVIAYPELAFDQDPISKGYNDYFVTVKEFKRTLEELYKNDYILIDINLLINKAGSKVTANRTLMLPEGKKPLVLSIDDMNYYDYMRKNGNVYKLILNDEGEVCSYTIAPDGKEVISQDNAIVPILDQFVKEHPDFSFQGAKGLIALTGYQGVLGYRTNQRNSEDFNQKKRNALKVIERLKETGWTFASHGYGHLDARKVSYDRLVKDTKRWKKEVESLIGPTAVYVYPYGSRVVTGSKKFKMLVDSGFTLLASVGPSPYLKGYNHNAIMMDRRHIDGISLQTQQDRLSPLMDADYVLQEKVRP